MTCMYRITNGCYRPFGAGTAFPPLRGSKPAPKPGVSRLNQPFWRRIRAEARSSGSEVRAV